MATKNECSKLLKASRKAEHSTPLWVIEKLAKCATSFNKAVASLKLCGLSNAEAREIAAHVRRRK